ncbi:hypothetical protein GW796_10010 [archaeon]|nr:hypothetical protein [archaeon]
MNKFIEALEKEKHSQALEILQQNPSLFNKKSDDGWSVLQLASYYNSPTIISYSLLNLSYDEINNSKVHPILIAFQEKNEEVIKSFLDFEDPSKINWQIKETNGDNLLSLAIFNKLFNIIPQLISNGVSGFENNNQNISAFYLAVEIGDTKILDILDEQNNLAESYSELFIKKSIQYDHVDVFERLQPYTQLSQDKLFDLTVGFNSVKVMNQIMDNGEFIPGTEQITKIVDVMCKKHDHDDDISAAKNLADFLFEIKIPFNKFINDLGQSAWMLCIQNNNDDVFERLMHSSENVNVTDSEQHSPLFYAIEKNNFHFVKLLLKQKANPHQLDKQKNNSLIKAVEKGNIEIVKEILKYCHSVNDININNEHALSIAIKRKRMDIVSELIWAGGEITTNPVKFIEEKNFFHFSIDGHPERFAYHDEEHIDNFVALSRLGFKLDQTNEDGDTFLLHFIKNGYIANFVALLRCQFNPNQTDLVGNSALICAAMKRTDEYFNAIINKFSNIDYNHKNNNGDNVYDVCLKTRKTNRIEKLVDADNSLSIENAMKAAKMIAKDGNLEVYYKKLAKSGMDFSFLDENQNNLLMFSLVGGNIDNFKFLIETVGVTIEIEQANKNNNTICDMINAMPPEIGKEFNFYLNKSLKKSPN